MQLIEKEAKKTETGGFVFGISADEPIKTRGRGSHYNLSEVYLADPFLS